MYLSIKKVQSLPNYKLELTFENNEVKIFDVKPYLNMGMFKTLKKIEKRQTLFLNVNLSEQLVPGTYEYTLTRLINNKLDLSIFDRKYNNQGSVRLLKND